MSFPRSDGRRRRTMVACVLAFVALTAPTAISVASGHGGAAVAQSPISVGSCASSWGCAAGRPVRSRSSSAAARLPSRAPV
jgi:hypothetical protein